MFMLFPLFGHEFRVRGDGLGVHCVESVLFCWVDGDHQLFVMTRQLTKIRHRGGDTVQGGLLEFHFPGTYISDAFVDGVCAFLHTVN